ncbi:hypothetical protein FOE78_22495 [Microlunatus elymi]|uniref:Uncharacterized protein n=1 Tax=Microlunatus elymi TaxID=2596828 RepID=A0A516Q4C5_9ACTN|nr:hypothetical protein [Microlunatus elymi]QDP98307.1 hypothetical protein FOE78_22495 [Microlunatus elymi]
MYQGVLIAESLKIGAELDQRLTLTKIARVRPGNTVAGQPETWTIIEFELAADHAPPFADGLAAALQEPGWYCDFRSDRDVYVIFPGQVFHYPRGDDRGRAEAIAYGRDLGVPESQLDWPK